MPDDTKPSLKPPKEFFDRMHAKLVGKKDKNGKPYTEEQIGEIIGNLWYHQMSETKRAEERHKEGKEYGKSPTSKALLLFLPSNLFKGENYKLSENTRAKIGTAGSSKREDMNSGDFLNAKEKKYPWKIGGKPSKKLLVAAIRRATMNGDDSIASKAKGLLKKHFDMEYGGDKD